jgi:hypothetical protein
MIMKYICLFFLFTSLLSNRVYIPINSANRKELKNIELTKIGQFGLLRKARPGIPAHFHTGIDIKRPGSNYESEPIYPVADGIVISKRTDGPYANLIIEHEIQGRKFWTLYEHVASIEVNINDKVNSQFPVARYMNKRELCRYGWQFDHFHLEILKVKPKALKPTRNNPERFFDSYSLVCYSREDLNKYYYNPLEFLQTSL